MFERTRRGFAIASSGFKLLLAHPRLILLPLFSSVTAIAALGLVGTGMFFAQAQNFNPLFFIPGFILLLLLLSFAGVFFNCALVACVLDAFAGRPVSLKAGLAAAMTRLPHILEWVVYTTIVGFFIRLAQDSLRKLGLVGALLGGAAGLSWAMITFLVLPVLVAEDLSPGQAVKRSTQIIKQSWGSAVGVETGLGLLILLSILPVILLIALVNGGAQPAIHAGAALMLVGGVSLLYFVLLTAFFSTLNMIFRTGVYAYATTGRIPLSVDAAAFESSFRR